MGTQTTKTIMTPIKKVYFSMLLIVASVLSSAILIIIDKIVTTEP